MADEARRPERSAVDVYPFLLVDDLKVTLDALALMGGRSLVGKGELTP